MKLFAEPRVTIKKRFEIFMRYSKLVKLATCLERIRKLIEPASSTQTGRQVRAAVLHGPRNLKLEYIPEEVRVDVRFCGLTGSDVLLWRGEHRRTPEPTMVLGFQVSGTILEMGGLAHEQTDYQIGEEVVVHNYPACSGLAETCLAHYRVRQNCLEKLTLLLTVPLGVCKSLNRRGIKLLSERWQKIIDSNGQYFD
ncbi:Quinone oxidoreductase-like protein [Ooceraea biroi]|uniref:Quinone oxidoreductase-like protein n=1 Tax=Ooceraea biroi TaxID=2015173 RepID=A0A026WTB5_OOCBI|nr:Quinone oxidoreductase-like protein [Ooceraea biroi]